MYIKSLEYIHQLLIEKMADLDAQHEEIHECLIAYNNASKEVRGDVHNEAAYAELQTRYAKVDAERDLVTQVKADFERTNWH